MKLFFSDGLSLFVIQHMPGQFLCRSFDPDNAEETNQFPLQINLHPTAQPCVDENCIYLPTTEGVTFGIDKFSGKKIVDLPHGFSITKTNLKQDTDFVYQGVCDPISNGRTRTLDAFSICVNNKLTGEMVGKSNLVRKTISEIAVHNQKIYFTDNDRIYCHSHEGEQLSSCSISRSSSFAPVILNDSILSVKGSGIIESFGLESLTIRKRSFIGFFVVNPCRYGDSVILFTTKGVYIVEGSMQTNRVSEYNESLISHPVICNHMLYALSETGNCVKLNCQTQEITVSFLGRAVSSQPWPSLVINNKVFLTDGVMIYDTISKSR